MRKSIIILLVVVLLLFITLGIGYLFFLEKDKPHKITSVNEEKTTKAVTYLMIDINPSVELLLDDANKVIEMITLNEDADIAYSDLNVVGQSVVEATNNIIDAAAEMGYINEVDDDQEINLAITSEDSLKETEITNLVTNSVETNINQKELPVLITKNKMSDEVKSAADNHQISYGKMLLIRRAMFLDKTLIETDLVPLSVKQIQTKIKAIVKLRISAKKMELNNNNTTYRQLKTEQVAKIKAAIEVKKTAIYNKQSNNKNLSTAQKQEIIRNRKAEIRLKIAKLKRQ